MAAAIMVAHDEGIATNAGALAFASRPASLAKGSLRTLEGCLEFHSLDCTGDAAWSGSLAVACAARFAS